MQITIDTKLKLLFGLPIEVKNYGFVEPLKLKTIVEFGYQDYLKELNIMCIKKEQLSNEIPEDFNEFDVLYLLGDKEVNEAIKNSLSFFLQDKVHLLKQEGVIVVGTKKENFKFINRDTFQDIRTVIQLQNGMLSLDEYGEIKHKNTKAKEISERMKRARAEVERIKKKETGEEPADFFDILSAISSKSNSISKLELLDMTIFQVYEEFKRLNLIDQYETSIMAMLQGAKNVKLKHWSSKIN